MRKVHIVSSLLVAFGLSIFSMGCDPAKKPATNPGKKIPGLGSTTGGGMEVPGGTSGVISNSGSLGPDKNASEGGTAEKPEAKPAEEKKPEDKPAEEKTEAKPEEKPADEKKADEKPAEEKKAVE